MATKNRETMLLSLVVEVEIRLQSPLIFLTASSGGGRVPPHLRMPQSQDRRNRCCGLEEHAFFSGQRELRRFDVFTAWAVARILTAEH